jgi:hypothetical protein
VSGGDIGASVRQRLLNRSRAEDRPFQELLQYFAMERFLYRLAKSPYADRFILKGGTVADCLACSAFATHDGY